MATKHNLSDSKWNKVEDCLTYFAARSEYVVRRGPGAGYPIGSGVVEGPAATWSRTGWNEPACVGESPVPSTILSLRAIYVNDNWDAFHADRIQTEQRKLYPYKKHLGAILNCAA